jgi:hypothetical protein
MARFSIEEGAQYGGVNNMLAIAQVLRNRVFSGWGDWLEVVTQAAARRGNADRLPEPNMRTGDVRVLLNRIDEIYTKADMTDLTGGALFYVDPGRQIAGWFHDEVMRRPDEHPRTAHIGPVWFFK